MPSLKQVASLQDMAMNSLVASFLGFRLDEDMSWEDTFKGISLWKKKIRAGMAPKFVSDFYNRLLNDLMLTDMQVRELRRIWLKIVMDETIIGLDCGWEMQKKLRRKDAYRIRGITRLQVDQLPPGYSLNTFHLEYLTVFEYTYWCTDSDLQVLAANCPKLEDVDVSYSHAVTDVGLVALASSLPELQFLRITKCLVTPSGLNNLLSASKSIRHLWAWCCPPYGPGFDFRKLPNWEVNLSVSESLESFTIVEDLTNEDLLHLVSKFPNLQWIDISAGDLKADLNVFKSFGRLSKLKFYACDDSRWTEFESLLEFFGPQIVDLNVRCNMFSTMQQFLDSIFRRCKNLEDLFFDCYYFEPSPSAKLVVPPFEELKKFECKSYESGNNYLPKLELGEMSKLEYLVIHGFNVDVDEVEAIILDHINFPNLKVIEMMGFWDSPENDLNRLRRIVTTNNLDLEIK